MTPANRPAMTIGAARQPATRQELFERLAELGIRVTTTEHPPVFTVAESTALHRDIPGAHTKNLFLKDAKGRLFLVTAHVDTEVDLKGLHKRVGASRFSFGKPDLLMSVLGVPPGSVTPFALINDTDLRVRFLIDQALLQFDTINCHPLENTATTSIARDDLLRFIRSCGHTPGVADLTSAAG